MSARPVATIGADGATTEIVQLVALPPGWRAIWRDGDGATVPKPCALAALVVYRWPDRTGAEPMQAVIPMVGWPDTGALELADEPQFVGLVGPGEDAP
ncbi:MAG: hypothetical protein J0H15_13665 [Xanthomonadales bacterium]|nr:hypothetical protein [Xanthomonadales bacterium]